MTASVNQQVSRERDNAPRRPTVNQVVPLLVDTKRTTSQSDQSLRTWLTQTAGLETERLQKALDCAEDAWVGTVAHLRRVHAARRLEDVFPLSISLAIQDALQQSVVESGGSRDNGGEWDTDGDGVVSRIEFEANLEAAKNVHKTGVCHLIKRFLKLQSTPIELLILPDHMPWFKRHWTEAYKNDGTALKDGFLFMYELELIFGSLLFGTLTGAYFSAVDESMRSDFTENRVLSLGFWIVTLGTIALVTGMLQVVNSYLTMLQILPINIENAYAFFKSQNVNNMMNVANVMLVTEFYCAMIFMLFLLMKHNAAGGHISTFSICIAAIMCGWVPMMSMFHGTSFNLSMATGLFGEQQVIPDHMAASCDRTDVDAVLTQCAMRNLKRYGQKPVPAHGNFYPGIHKGRADEREGGDEGPARRSSKELSSKSIQGRPAKRPFRPFRPRTNTQHAHTTAHIAAHVGIF